MLGIRRMQSWALLHTRLAICPADHQFPLYVSFPNLSDLQKAYKHSIQPYTLPTVELCVRNLRFGVPVRGSQTVQDTGSR